MKKKIDRFTILEALGGSGAQSTVFKASETLAGDVTRTVALKVLPVIAPKEKAAEAHFLAELQALMALGGHPHVVALLGAGLTDGTPWIAMEYLPTSLASQTSDQPVLSPEVIKMIEHTAQALDAMHTQEPPLMHNDLKPANILLDRFSTYKLTDFGSATLVALESTHALGTIRYAAPEVLSREFGKVCPATDLYALGHIAYEMALGGRNYRRQFPAVFESGSASKEANPARWMAWHCSFPTKATPISDIQKDFPRRISDIIAKMMAKPLSERYASAKDLLADLHTEAPPAAAPLPVSTHGTAAAGKSPPLVPHDVARPAVAAAPAGAPTGSYYVRLRGKLSGPYDLPTLKRQAKQGGISRLHQVSSDKITWLSASSVEGLF